MKDSIKIFSISGIPIELHISFVVLMLFLFITSIYFGSPGFIFYILLLFFFVFLHELAHSLVAKRYNVKISKIILLPFGGVSAMEHIPEEPSKELAIAIAGPLLNFLAVAITLVPVLLLPSGTATFQEVFFSLGMPRNLLELAAIILKVNLLLGAFNLLVPALPMDGGRILRAALAMKIGFAAATDISVDVAKVIAILMFVFGFLFSPWLALIAFFIYIGAMQEAQITLISSVLRGVKVRDIMSTGVISLSPGMSLNEATDVMIAHRHMGYPVVQSDEVIGIFTFADLAKVEKERWASTVVEQVMTKEVISSSPDEDATDALFKMHSHGIGRLPVFVGGKLVGIISKTDILRATELLRIAR